VGLLALVNPTTAVFGALAKRRRVVEVATVSLVVNLAVAAIATPRMGHVGVAIAMAASTGTQLALLLVAVRREVPVSFDRVFPSIARVLAATGLTALCARFLVLRAGVVGAGTGVRLRAIVCGALLLGVYLAAAWMFQCEEAQQILRAVQNRLRRNRKPAP
jgi:O-antigen/teichoic acid export membrane protein